MAASASPAAAQEWLKEDKRRMLHVVYRVGDLKKSIDYYTKHFGMKLLRSRDIPAGAQGKGLARACGVAVRPWAVGLGIYVPAPTARMRQHGIHQRGALCPDGAPGLGCRLLHAARGSAMVPYWRREVSLGLCHCPG